MKTHINHTVTRSPSAGPRRHAQRRVRSRCLRLCGVVALLVLCAVPPSAVGVPPRGSDAPDFVLKDLDGVEIHSAKLTSRTLVLIFGELDHDGVSKACAEAMNVVSDPRLEGRPAMVMLVVASDQPSELLKEQAAQGHYPAIILHDPDREAFGAYRVLVMPTVVVVSPAGKVVNSISGPIQRSQEILAESVLFAAGAIGSEQFERVIGPTPQHPSPDAARAERLVHLGTELYKHRLYDLAEARFADAIALAPESIEARLGLARVLLHTDRLADAERLFRDVAAADPDSVEATLGIAEVQARRGTSGHENEQADPKELAAAELAVSEIIARQPSLPRARYVLGLIYEKKGDSAAAAVQYKKAAELLLDR